MNDIHAWERDDMAARQKAEKEQLAEMARQEATVWRQDEKPARVLRLNWWDDIRPDLALPWIVDDVLPEGGFAVLYGESGSKKTFLALHLAFYIATGRTWFGRDVAEGATIYLAVEGPNSVRKRVEAIRRYYDIDSNPPFALITDSVDLCDPQADTSAVIAAIVRAKEELALPVRLVVVDTLSRAFGGGDENGPADMGSFINNIDAIRAATGAAVLIVHHSGKDQARGARGHGSLRAATDVELESVPDRTTGVSVVTIRKNRDGREGRFCSFELESIEIGVDARGKPQESAVVVPAEQLHAGPKPLSGAARMAMQQLDNALVDAGEQAPQSRHIPAGVRVVKADIWRTYCQDGGVSSADNPDNKARAIRRLQQQLQAVGLIGVWADYVWKADNRTSPGQGADQ